MIRTVLSNAQWERIAPELPGKIGDPGRSGDDNRLFVEGVLDLERAITRLRETLGIDRPREMTTAYLVERLFAEITRQSIRRGAFTSVADSKPQSRLGSPSATPAKALQVDRQSRFHPGKERPRPPKCS